MKIDVKNCETKLSYPNLMNILPSHHTTLVILSFLSDVFAETLCLTPY